MIEAEREIWKDAYRFFSAFNQMGNTDEDWRKCVTEVGQLSEKYENHPLMIDLLVAVYGYLSDMRKPLAAAETMEPERKGEQCEKTAEQSLPKQPSESKQPYQLALF